MIEFINNKERTVNDFLECFHLSKSNIYKILTNKLISYKYQDNHIIDLSKSDIIPNEAVVIINIEVLEDKNNYIADYKKKDNLDIVYEDDNYIVINKPRGILVHSDGNNKETLIDLVNNHCLLNNENCTIRCSHRLDVETTGIVIFTKNLFVQCYLDYLMTNNLVTKKYRALVTGIVKEESAVITEAIGKNRHKNGEYIVSKTGKSAYTEYKVVNYFKNKTLLDVKIKTGRTHQIRVHLAYIKHPIVGDKIYGFDKEGKMMLKAYSIGFINYDNTYIEFKIEESI